MAHCSLLFLRSTYYYICTGHRTQTSKVLVSWYGLESFREDVNSFKDRYTLYIQSTYDSLSADSFACQVLSESPDRGCIPLAGKG